MPPERFIPQQTCAFSARKQQVRKIKEASNTEYLLINKHESKSQSKPQIPKSQIQRGKEEFGPWLSLKSHGTPPHHHHPTYNFLRVLVIVNGLDPSTPECQERVPSVPCPGGQPEGEYGVVHHVQVEQALRRGLGSCSAYIAWNSPHCLNITL